MCFFLEDSAQILSGCSLELAATFDVFYFDMLLIKHRAQKIFPVLLGICIGIDVFGAIKAVICIDFKYFESVGIDS